MGKFTDRPTDSGAAAHRTIPARNPSRGSVGGAPYTDPGCEETGAPAHAGNRNSPPLDVPMRREHTMASNHAATGDLGRRGYRKLPMPGPNVNSPDMPVDDETSG